MIKPGRVPYRPKTAENVLLWEKVLHLIHREDGAKCPESRLVKCLPRWAVGVSADDAKNFINACLARGYLENVD